MADHIEREVLDKGLTGACAGCSAVVESLYRVIAEGEGHTINDAGMLAPHILHMAMHGFKYVPSADHWERLANPSVEPEEHMLHYINDHFVKTHHMMTLLSPYYLQNERHQLHKILCVDLLKHCTHGIHLAPHHTDIHEDYDLKEYKQKYYGEL